MFISNAYAAAEIAAEGSALSGTLIQLALILLIFYFLLIRPQQKRNKAHEDMVTSLKAGDRVMTGGGIYGTVTKVNGTELELEIAPNVNITIERMAISQVIEITENFSHYRHLFGWRVFRRTKCSDR